MKFHTAIIVISSLALSLAAGTRVLADDRYDDYQATERFKLRIGGFLIDRFDTTARFDSTQYPIGTLIDLEEDFNVDPSETVLRIDGFYRFNNRHRLDWTYYRSRRSGSAVAEEEYVIGDPDDPEGGFIIPKDARVTTQWNYDLLKIGYAYSFLNKRRYEMFIGAGLNIRNLDVEIDYEVTITTFGDSDSLDGEGLIPLPTAVIGGRWNFTDKWQGIFKYELFMLEMGDYKGNQQDFQLLFEHSTFKHVGFGLGINTVDINIRAQDEKIRGEFDSRILGLLGYIKFYL
jgi:hypothetical protein